MSGWDSDSSSSGGPADLKSFRQISKERLLHEMLRSTKGGDSKAAWKVLIMDNITTRVMSYCCKMSHITDEGVSSVENLYKRRQPLPSMEAVYFILPSKENISIFLSDMSGKSPLYKKAYVFFSSPVPRELVAHIKSDSKVRPRIGALCEMNLEYIAIDRQAFITDHESALEDLFGENIDNSHKYNDCLNTMARRIATVFVSMKEFPNIHYSAAKSSLDASTMTTLRDLFPTKLAAGVWNCLIKYKTTIPNFPQKETCELLIIDRSIDQIVPVIHEWTYDAMCHDLLNMNGNKYVQEVTSNSGVVSKKEVLLEEHDPLWAELRHCHIADASERLHDKMTNFLSKNKAAQVYHESRNGSELSTRDLQKMVQALPQYSEQIDRLSLHVEIAGKINKIIRETGLRDLGQLEQDLVFGDAGTKEVINFLKTEEEISSENKMRLLMIYAAIYQDKFDGERFSKLMQLARLSSDDMKAVINMRYLADPSSKKTSRPGFSFKLDLFRQKKHATRKERDVEGTWALSRFYPLIEDLIEKVSKDELPKHEYSCINGPSSSFHLSPSVSVRSTQVQPSQSMRSRRTGTWARPRNSDDGYSSDSVLKHASSDFKKMGRRVFIFIVGGATRSELRAVHKLTTKLNREIILGSTSIDDPPQFIKKMKKLSGEDLSLDELHI